MIDKIGGRSGEERKIIEKIIKSGNEHVFYYWNELSSESKNKLINQLKSIDLESISNFYNEFKDNVKTDNVLEPAKYLSIEENNSQNDLTQIGKDSLKNGEVAFLTVAGGQGSRLGYEHPKGCFPISPIKKKPLFQLFAEKILFYSDYYPNKYFWYIMTSEYNYEETIDFFALNNYFGFDKNNIIFFKQGLFPSLDMEGKLILGNKDELFMNPDGHGGILKALLKNNLITQMKDNGIRHLSYFQVDNPLVDMADPGFIGYHIKEKSMVTSKVIAKLYPEEKLGVIGRINGKNGVIEYSDLPEKEMYAVDENNRLQYLMGSIAIHIFDIDFLVDFTEKMPIHYAEKSISGYIFNKNSLPVIGEMQGIKFETFVFDTIPLAEKSLFFETKREDEFFPVKNKEGFDSIETCIIGQSKLFYSWLRASGVVNNEYKNQIVEINPLYAPNKEIFLEKAAENTDKLTNAIFINGTKIRDKIYIE